MQQLRLEESRLARYAAEFTGTFVLVLTYGCNILSGNWLSGPTSNAAVLAALTYCMADISGGHFNPAVSLSMGVTGLMSMGEAMSYVCAQFVGGILGALTYSLMFWESFSLGPMEGYSWLQAGVSELIYSFMLCSVFLHSAVVMRQKGDQSFGLAVGFVMVAGGYAVGSISGGYFNPATALAVDVTSIHTSFGWCAVYCGFQFLGAALASICFRIARPEELHQLAVLSGEMVQRRGPQAAAVSEFVGTFLLVITLALNAFTPVPLNAAWSVAACLASLVLALGDVSGAHFNPAVTLAVFLGNAWPQQQRSRDGTPRSSNVPRTVAYIAVQLGASLLANFVCTVMHGWTRASSALHPKIHNEEHGKSIFFEVLFTFLLCFTVLSTATEKLQRPLNQYAGVAIGLCVLAGGLVVSAFGAGTLNPAATVGGLWNDSMLLGGGSFWERWDLLCAEVFGAALAVVLLSVVQPSDSLRVAKPGYGAEEKAYAPQH